MNTFYSPLAYQHEEKYDDKPRLDILELFPGDCRKVLEIGCGTGATGAVIKEKIQGLYYVGLEVDENAVKIAETRLDKVLAIDLGEIRPDSLPLPQESFDLLIAADVLEHLYDPWRVMDVLRLFLKSDGKVVLSIPNTQNIHLITNLVQGNWNYEKYGLLDATHIRFFTLKEIEKLLIGAGYHILRVSNQLQTPLDNHTFPLDITIANLVLKNISREEAQKLFTFQYLILAEKVNRSEKEMQ
ncbi:MAG: class I SAM-dependent methyltransferase [Thermodesulfobacteriota bacterium]